MAPTKGTPSISQKILNATASLSKGTTKHVSRQKVAALCGFPKKESRSYTNQIGILKNEKKYIVVDKESITLTDLGLQHAEAVPSVQSNQEALDKAKEQIKMTKGKEIFDILSDGRTYSRAKIGEKIDYDITKRSFTNIVGPLRTLDFIEYVKDDEGQPALRMLDELFPFGRPSSPDDEE